MNRDDYMNGIVDHNTYYCAVADALGRQAIERIVLTVAPLPTLKACFGADPHMNNIPLGKWDRLDSAVRTLVHPRHLAISWSAKAQAAGGMSAIQPRHICWSLSESVCVLKAAARRMVLEMKEVAK